MSKLMSWTRYCNKADKKLKKHVASAGSGSESHYQLKGTAELASMEQTIMSWRENVMHSAFIPERKRFCLKIDGHLRAAYAKASNQPTGPMSSLQEPFLQLKNALRQLMIIRDFDDRVPVKAAEAPIASRGAEDAWLTIKLQYAKACLVLLVRIFWLVLPKYPEWWEEIEASLNNEDWLKQFILDSRKSERLAVYDRKRLPDVLEEFRRQKRAIDRGEGPEKGA
ncbi:hypothetical protein PG985_012305 [Apiospora marii]|uniref:Uncharacterized protein n=1 Tax=Apiospora marii TaxID=335849 RepID=A0ABR1RDQ1_9PEZI